LIVVEESWYQEILLILRLRMLLCLCSGVLTCFLTSSSYAYAYALVKTIAVSLSVSESTIAKKPIKCLHIIRAIHGLFHAITFHQILIHFISREAWVRTSTLTLTIIIMMTR